MILQGTFTSIWDDGTEIITPAELNTETGKVTTESVEAGDVNILNKEYFTDNEENEYDVCPECHEYILKTVMKNGIGKTLYEAQVCSNPDCENQ